MTHRPGPAQRGRLTTAGVTAAAALTATAGGTSVPRIHTRRRVR